MRIKDEAGKFISIDPVERLKNSYIVDPDTGCWNYINISSNGYGKIYVYGKHMNAHRFSYETFVGKLDSNLEICHNCNNKSCINPEHLRQDTRSSNSIDKVYDGKQNGQILTPEQVIEIKKELQNTYYGINKILANRYGVSNGVISQIRCNRKWKHITID
jgi:hypothetical protein